MLSDSGVDVLRYELLYKILFDYKIKRYKMVFIQVFRFSGWIHRSYCPILQRLSSWLCRSVTNSSLLNRVPCVPCVPFNLLVPSCLRCWRALVPTCPNFRRALVPSMLACPHALVPTCPNFWRALVPSMLACPRALVPACPNYRRALVPVLP